MNTSMKMSVHVVRTVSGCAGGESIRGPKTNCVAAHSTSSLILADLALVPDHSGLGLALSWLPTTATIHCMSLSKAELTATAIFETRSNVCPTLPVTSGE